MADERTPSPYPDDLAQRGYDLKLIDRGADRLAKLTQTPHHPERLLILQLLGEMLGLAQELEGQYFELLSERVMAKLNDLDVAAVEHHRYSVQHHLRTHMAVDR